MHASASTWTYYVSPLLRHLWRQIATSLYPTLPVQEHFVLTFEDVARLGQLGCTPVVKNPSGRWAAVEAFIAELPHRRNKSSGGLMDFGTPFTRAICRWRHTLTETQVLEVEQRLAGRMDHFSYQRCQML
jgi:hypothetical protein